MADRTGNLAVRRGRAPAAGWRPTMGLWPDVTTEMDRLFDALRPAFGRGFPGVAPEGLIEQTPAVDVIDKEHAIVVRAELPGMEQDDVDVQLTDHSLKIQAEKREEREEGQEEGDYYLSELRYGSFQRVLPLPTGIDRNAVSANFRNGILTVTLPKTKETLEQTKRVEIES